MRQELWKHQEQDLILKIHSHQTQFMGYVEMHNAVDATLNLIEQVRTECRDHPAALVIESGTCHVTFAELGSQADTIAEIARSV